jgi:hypothetical protein
VDALHLCVEAGLELAPRHALAEQEGQEAVQLGDELLAGQEGAPEPGVGGGGEGEGVESGERDGWR